MVLMAFIISSGEAIGEEVIRIPNILAILLLGPGYISFSLSSVV